MPKWRKDSVFGDGPRVPLDREQKAQFKARLRLQRRPGRVTLGALEVGLALVNMVGNDGRLDPSHKHLAKVAGVGLSTVKRALCDLRDFGFLDWARRLVRSKATGWRCEQATNSYVLRVPTCEVHFRRPVDSCESKEGKAAQEQVRAAATVDIVTARAALDRARKDREAALAATWAARYA